MSVRHRLNFNYYLQSVKEKVSKSVGAVKRVLRVDYGLGRKAVCVICKGLKKRNLCDDESCFYGEAVEDFQHVLCSYPLYDDIRNLAEMQITQEEIVFSCKTA